MKTNYHRIFLDSYDIVLPRWLPGFYSKEPICQCKNHKRQAFNPWVRKIPWRGKWQPTPVFLPREFHGQRSLVGYSPWGCNESNTTEQLSTAQQHSPPRKMRIHPEIREDKEALYGWGRSPGKGNGYQLQYSCLENSMDRGAWRATVPGVAKSWTRLKRLSEQACCWLLSVISLNL